jgi:hypothetical protein
LNHPHPTYVTPSWNGDSVGHYEGDTLIIDTVGTKAGPFAMVDGYGTPHTAALHVVERYRLLEYEAAKEYWEGNAKANFRIPSSDIGAEVDPAYTGKVLQLEFTVEDEGVFTMPTNSRNSCVARTGGNPGNRSGRHLRRRSRISERRSDRLARRRERTLPRQSRGNCQFH